MTQWEYSKIDLSGMSIRTSDMDLLEAAGKDGWELVGVTNNNFAYLKRPLTAAAPAAELSDTQPARRKPASRRAAEG